MKNLTLRKATHADSETLLSWANDPQTRAQSFNNKPIARETHEKWLEQKLCSAETHFYIAELQRRPCATIRFDKSDGNWIISITVAPQFRRKGIGRKALGAAMETFLAVEPRASVIAYIKPGNAASVRLFQSAGFGPEATTLPDRLALRFAGKAVRKTQ